MGLVGTAVAAVVLYGLLLVLLVLLGWWATVALVCRIGRQLFPFRRSPGSGQSDAGASVLDAGKRIGLVRRRRAGVGRSAPNRTEPAGPPDPG